MKTDNELIAEFMGQKVVDHWVKLNAMDEMVSSNLKYNTSWDWLMPVVKKINKIASEIGIRSKHFLFEHGEDIAYTHDAIHEACSYVRIDDCNKKVVEFIKWYNNSKGL